MYSWIIVIGGLFSFFAAMGIGANDVANAIGPLSAAVLHDRGPVCVQAKAAVLAAAGRRR